MAGHVQGSISENPRQWSRYPGHSYSLVSYLKIRHYWIALIGSVRALPCLEGKCKTFAACTVRQQLCTRILECSLANNQQIFFSFSFPSRYIRSFTTHISLPLPSIALHLSSLPDLLLANRHFPALPSSTLRYQTPFSPTFPCDGPRSRTAISFNPSHDSTRSGTAAIVLRRHVRPDTGFANTVFFARCH